MNKNTIGRISAVDEQHWTEEVREVFSALEGENAKKQGSENFQGPTEEKLMLEIGDYVASGKPLDDAKWQQLKAYFTVEQQLDILFIAGNYNMLSWLQSSLDIQLENGLSNDFHS